MNTYEVTIHAAHEAPDEDDEDKNICWAEDVEADLFQVNVFGVSFFRQGELVAYYSDRLHVSVVKVEDDASE